jgi:hypothetical protein
MCDEQKPLMSEQAVWFKSSRSGASGAGACVEIAKGAGGVAIRDSKDRSGPVLLVAAACWEAFLALVREGVDDLLN